MRKRYETKCYLFQESDTLEDSSSSHLSLHTISTDERHSLPSRDLIPVIVSYEDNHLHEIQLILPSNEVFSLTNDSFSHLYIDPLDNNSVNIPLTNTPYLDVTHAQFREDPLMIQLTKYYLNFMKRKLTPSQFYGRQKHASKIFVIFPRQELAFQYFDELASKEFIKIFSFEAPLTGRRKFLVSEISIFHEKYRCNVSRHVYEIIREGYPCRLYFDLEYSKETNPEVNGEAIVELWISLVIWKVYELYGILIASKNIIHLDSSTEKKFSRHLIFLLVVPKDQKVDSKKPLPRSQEALPSLADYVEYLFIDNIEVGNFVLSILSQCFSPNSSSDDSFTLPRQFRNMSVKEAYSILWLLNTDRSSRVCVVDLGVYTRNRAFRLLSSTKYGKDAKLEIQRVSEAKSSKLSIPLPLSVEENFQYSIPEKIEQSPEDLWYLSPSEWISGNSSQEESQGRKRKCQEKIISDYTTQFNYFVRLVKHSNSSSFPTEILERTFIIPLGVTSPSPSDLNSSFQLLPSLEKIITKSDLLDSGCDIPYCISCGIPSSFQNPSCRYHGENLCIFSLPQHAPQLSENIYSSSNSTSYPSQTHEPFRNEFTNIEEILCSKRLSANGQCQSPFPIFDEFVLYIASLNANPLFGPLRITQFSLKSMSPIMTQSDPSNAYLPPLYTITYQMSGTKFCHRIGRHHKSNHIMYEANLNQGYVIQKCWDPDCRGYKSPPYFIPHHTIPQIPDLREIQEVIADIVLINSLSSSAAATTPTTPLTNKKKGRHEGEDDGLVA